MLQQLENTQGISVRDKNMFKLIFILGFRAGLRINETLNIFVRDLFINEDTVILTIRNNRNKNQKAIQLTVRFPYIICSKQTNYTHLKHIVRIENVC